MRPGERKSLALGNHCDAWIGYGCVSTMKEILPAAIRRHTCEPFSLEETHHGRERLDGVSNSERRSSITPNDLRRMSQSCHAPSRPQQAAHISDNLLVLH